jgi:hypothetical protein
MPEEHPVMSTVFISDSPALFAGDANLFAASVDVDVHLAEVGQDGFDRCRIVRVRGSS